MDFKVKWQHGVYIPKNAPKILHRQKKFSNIFSESSKSPEERKFTKCIITLGSEEFIGIASLYYKDIENRKIGNKMAFKKAVLQIPNRETRTKLWEWFKDKHIKCLSC